MTLDQIEAAVPDFTLHHYQGLTAEQFYNAPVDVWGSEMPDAAGLYFAATVTPVAEWAAYAVTANP